MKEHNSNWPEITDHPYRILLIGGSGYGKTNALLNLINVETVKFIYMQNMHMKQHINC